MQSQGLLITLYGINNIGKTTHAKILARKLRKAGYKAEYIKFPIYDLEPTGPFLFHTLRNPDGQLITEDELQLWFVLNRYQYQPELKRMLNEGTIVVAEDYIGTGIAWGMAKGLDEEWLISCNKHLMKEDFALMLQGKRSLHSKEDHHVHEQNDELSEKSIQVHNYLAEKFGWNVVPLQNEVMDTANLLWKVVDDFLQGR